MTTATSASAELPPGYYLDPKGSGAWMSLPWPGDRSLPWDHPSRLGLLPPSLGPSLIRWGESWLVHHLTGDPWRYTAGQKRFFILWYSLDENLRWLYRRGVKRGAKGTGKDPLAAAWGLTELCGPVRPVGWDGLRPVGTRQRLPLVQYGANSWAQAKDLLRVANAMVSHALRDAVGFDGGETVSKIDGGGRVELLTASEMSAEGDPATAVGLNEVHHMTDQNGGMKTAKVAQRNVGKSPAELQARLIEFTNAHQQGADSRGERSYKAWQTQVSGRTRINKIDILYDTIEAPPTVDMTDPASLRAGIEAAYCDAPWRDVERLCDEANDPDTSVADLIRYYLNGLATAEDAWVDPGNFDACARPGIEVGDGEQVAMFLDCSKSGDSTPLVACRISDGHVITLDVWQKPHGQGAVPWLVPRPEVDAKVRDSFKRFRVMWFGVDPSPATDGDGQTSYWMPLIDDWHRDFKDRLPNWATPGRNGHSVLFDMRISQPGGLERLRAFTAMAEQTATDIDGDEAETETARAIRLQSPALTHDGDPSLRTHVHNARRRPNAFGVSLGKVSRDSAHLVDLAVAMVGARLGRRIALNSGKKPKRQGGRMW